MRGAIPPLSNTPSWRGAQNAGTDLPLTGACWVKGAGYVRFCMFKFTYNNT